MLKPRLFLLPLHRWIGLCAGAPFVLVALTGASMAFRPQLDPVINPRLLSVPPCTAPLSLDTLAAAARAANPTAGPLKFIRLYGEPGVPARVRFDDGRWVYLDPCSARVTGIEALYGGVLGTAARLHIFGFLGNHDRVAGSMALLFALGMLGCGVVLWWPASRQALRGAFTLKAGLSGRAFSLKLHKTVALYAAPVLLASAATGVPQAFGWGQQPSAPLVAPQVAPLAGGAQAAPLSIEQMWRRAQVLVPRARRTQIVFAPGTGGQVRFEMVARDAPHANALSYVYFSGRTGALQAVVPYASNSLAHKAYLFAAALHYGWVGGVAGQLLLMLGALGVPVLAWTGTASYLRRRQPAAAASTLRSVVVVRKTMETQDIASLELAAADGKPLPVFSAGAHIDVHLSGGLVRQYSLCRDPATAQHYQIGVLRTPESRGGSHAMHRLGEGDRLRIGGPKNHFPLAEAAERSLLLAGGIGITPILCMAETLHRRGADFELHYCARVPERAAFRQRILASPFAARTRFYFSEGPAQQRADLAGLLAHPSPGRHLYVCGPTGFMDAVIAMAQRQGWPGDLVHREYFAGNAQSLPDGPAFELRLARSGAIVRVAPGQSAVAALAQAGVAVPVSCEQGVCGTCVTRVLEGRPDHRDLFLSAAEKARNDCFTPCCSRAHSATLTLDL